MAKEEINERRRGEVLPDSRFRVTVDNGHNLLAYPAGQDAQEPYPHLGWRQGFDQNKGRIAFRRIEGWGPVVPHRQRAAAD